LKKEVMMNKKALSPLVATILLIAFAIALGVVVMNWGKAYIEEKAEFTAGPRGSAACGVMDLSAIKVGGNDRVCYDPADNSITAFLENGPDVRIDDISVRVVGSGGIEEIETTLGDPLEKGGSAKIKFNYPANVGAVQQVKFTPIVISEGERIPCTGEAAVSESISKC
jgi:flagellin-like protein